MKLALYHYDSCPYCQMVRHAARQLALDDELELRNIHQSSSVLQELVEATGRRTVPCLRIESDGGDVQWMHESYDIVAYLRQLAAPAKS